MALLQSLSPVRTISMSIHFFEHLAEKIGEWIDDLRVNGLAKQCSFTFREFLMENKIPRITLLGWRTKSPVLDLACKHAMECLGVMREAAALYFKVHPGMVMRVQHIYSDTWYEAIKSHEELKKPVTVIQSNAQIQQQGADICKEYVWEIEKLP